MKESRINAIIEAEQESNREKMIDELFESDAEKKRNIDILALKESLSGKWKDPSPLEHMYHWDDCSLCRIYFDVSNEKARCDGCPISLAIGSKCCLGTPVDRDHDGIIIGEWLHMVGDEQDFLNALLDHLEAGHDPIDFKEMTTYDWRRDAESQDE